MVAAYASEMLARYGNTICHVLKDSMHASIMP